MNFKYLGLIINNLGQIHKDVSNKVTKTKSITNMLLRWRSNRLGMIPCLILWHLFIKSQLRYAANVMISTKQSQRSLTGLENIYNQSLR